MTSKAKVCRICMLGNTKGVISLFAVCNGSDRIYNKIMQVANIQISIQDGLPTWICYSCLVHLETSYQFKIQAEKSDQLLRKQLESTNKEELDVVVIDNQVNPLQKQSQLRGLLSKPKTSDACVGTAFRPKNDEVLFKEQQNDIQGHFMSEVCEGISLTDNEQNGIKITNVVSHAQPETLEGCSIEADNAQTLSEEAICTCAKNTDGSKCDTCKKMLNMSKPFIELAQSGRNETSKQTSLLDMSGDNNNTPIDKPIPNDCLSKKHKTSATGKTEESHQFNSDGLTSNLIMIQDVNLITIKNPKIKSQGAVPIKPLATMHKVSLAEYPLSTPQGIVIDNPLTTNNLLVTSTPLIMSTVEDGGNNAITLSKDSDDKMEEIPDSGVFLKKKFDPVHNRYRCKICNEGFRRIGHIEIHNAEVHNDGNVQKSEGIYKCPICDQGFDYKIRLRIHLSSHNGLKPYKCDKCQKSFLYEDHLSLHKARHVQGQVFTCNVCDKKFKLKSHLNNHMFSHRDQKFVCEYCGKLYNSHSGLSTHKKIQHSENSKSLQCEQCGKSFTFQAQLNKHMHRHEMKPVTCNICNKKYQNQLCLKTHQYTVHTERKKHQCLICKKVFKYRCTLVTHMNTKHLDKEKPKCIVCDMKFSTKTCLKTHTKIIHSGLRPHTCKHCKMNFKWKQTCDKHELNCMKNKREIESDSEEVDEPQDEEELKCLENKKGVDKDNQSEKVDSEEETVKK